MSRLVNENGCNNHVHSTYSDGSKSVEELAEMAKKKKLKSMTITEHNLFNPKIPQLRLVYEKEGIEILNGIEFSTENILSSGKKTDIHIVCMLFNHKHSAFRQYLSMYENRKRFIEELTRRLAEKQMYITYEELEKAFPDTKALGIVHVAEMLVMKGYVKDIDEAMEYVGSRGARICYVDKALYMKFPSMETCINYIKEFCGFPILAHPYYPNDLTEEERIEVIQKFKKLVGKGNGGIEVYYKNYTEEEEKWILEQAGDDLLPSCGSDYHGVYADDRLDNYDYDITEKIKERHCEMYKVQNWITCVIELDRRLKEKNIQHTLSWENMKANFHIYVQELVLHIEIDKHGAIEYYTTGPENGWIIHTDEMDDYFRKISGKYSYLSFGVMKDSDLFKEDEYLLMAEFKYKIKYMYDADRFALTVLDFYEYFLEDLLKYQKDFLMS